MLQWQGAEREKKEIIRMKSLSVIALIMLVGLSFPSDDSNQHKSSGSPKIEAIQKHTDSIPNVLASQYGSLPKANEDKNKEVNKDDSARLKYDSIAAYSNLDMVKPSNWAAIFSFFGVVIGLLTLGYIWASSRRELRAYVHIIHAVPDQYDPEEKFPQIIQWQNLVELLEGHNVKNPPTTRYAFRIDNFGQTPAHRLQSWGRLVIAPTDNPPESIFVETDLTDPIISRTISTSSLGPGAISRIGIGFGDNGSLTDEQILGLSTGRLSIYVYGRIIYRDIFRRRRETNFRYAHTIGVRNEPDLTLGITNRGNEIT